MQGLHNFIQKNNNTPNSNWTCETDGGHDGKADVACSLNIHLFIFNKLYWSLSKQMVVCNKYVGTIRKKKTTKR